MHSKSRLKGLELVRGLHQIMQSKIQRYVLDIYTNPEYKFKTLDNLFDASEGGGQLQLHAKGVSGPREPKEGNVAVRSTIADIVKAKCIASKEVRVNLERKDTSRLKLKTSKQEKRALPQCPKTPIIEIQNPSIAVSFEESKADKKSAVRFGPTPESQDSRDPLPNSSPTQLNIINSSIHPPSQDLIVSPPNFTLHLLIFVMLTSVVYFDRILVLITSHVQQS